MGQIDGTKTRSEIRLMYEPYMTKVNAQRRLQPFGKNGDAIFAALAVAPDELIFTEANVLDAETQSSEQPKARSVQ